MRKSARSESLFKTAVVVLSVSVFLSGCASVKIHPEFNERHPRMKNLVLLPPDVRAYEITFNAGSKPLDELTASMEKLSAETVKTVVEEKGYELTPLSLSQKDLDSNPGLKDAFFELKTLYDQAIKDMQAGKKKSFTYDVGASGNYFAEKHGANAILYVREVGSRLSSGMTGAKVASATLSIATALLTGVAIGGPGQPQYGLLVETAVIDADLGDILWYNIKEAHDNFTNPADQKTLTKFVKDVLKPLPDSKFKQPKPGLK
ncbi:MAG: hypothetical protein HYT89_00885 [Candidatus Omnitrophica bacterium]|nr:hypothetical protein [Candidatus Omnitrophota bacterium]